MRERFYAKKRKKILLVSIILSVIFLGAIGFSIYQKFAADAAKLPDEARVNENDELTYYITVNSDGIDHEGVESGDSQLSKEYSGTTTVIDPIPADLIFEGFVTTDDGTFGAVSRDGNQAECSGKVIDDTHEEGVESGVWNEGETEYTYHGLHYNPSTKKVSFRATGITAGCQLTIGVKTRTPYLKENETRKDFYNTASYIDNTLIGKSNTVHAWIEKLIPTDIPSGQYYLKYKYIGDVPENAPELPETQYFDTNNAPITAAPTPSLENYKFRGWYWDYNQYSKGNPASSLTTLPGQSVEFYGEFTKIHYDDGTPEPEEDKHYVRYRYNGDVPQDAPKLPETKYYAQDEVIDVAPTPQVDCYSFDGWHYWPENAPYSTVVTNVQNYSSFKMGSVDMVLHGSFTWTCSGQAPEPREEVPLKFNVEYQVEGTKPDSFVTPRMRSYYPGSSVDLDTTQENDTIDGYSFSGWDSDQISVENQDTFLMPEKNVLLRGSFNREQYTVSYEYTGDLIPEGANSLLPESASYSAGDTVHLAQSPSLNGYVFSGWIADSEFEMPANNVVIRGSWSHEPVDLQEITPTITKVITNPKEFYQKGETVLFKTTITNDSETTLTNLYVQEILNNSEFTEGEGYSIQNATMAKIDSLAPNQSIVLNSKFELKYNQDKEWTNTVEIVAFEIADESYSLSDDYDNSASVNFVQTAIEGQPIEPDPGTNPEPDPDPNPSETPEPAKTPVTLDNAKKFIISGIVFASATVAIVYVCKKDKRSNKKYIQSAAIVTISLAGIFAINFNQIFADTLELNEEVITQTSNWNAGNGEYEGAWQVTESAEWSDVATAKLTIDIESKIAKNMHNKDIILVLDNSDWTSYAIDGTQLDHEDDPTTLGLMAGEAKRYAEQLLEYGDSYISVIPVWGDFDTQKTNSLEIASSQIDSIVQTNMPNQNIYSTAFAKVSDYLDNYTRTSGNSLDVVLVLDDHRATSSEIAEYRLLKQKINGGGIYAFGYGVRESTAESYSSASSAQEYGVGRIWGNTGGTNYNNIYRYVDGGLNKISDWSYNPLHTELAETIITLTSGAKTYDEFNVATTYNSDEFELKTIGFGEGEATLSGSTINWNLSNELFTGGKTKLIFELEAKNKEISRHQLFKLVDSINIQSRAPEIAAQNITNDNNLVLMNGFDLTYNINNSGTCSLGDNQSSVVWSHTRILPDEENIQCEGWNFDSFKDPATGDKYLYNTASYMPSEDIELVATWRKTDVEIHMDGQIYSVAPATLLSGSAFNAKIKELQGDRRSYILLETNYCPEYAMQESNEISDANSPTPIYAYTRTDKYVELANPNTGRESDKYTYYYPTYYCTNAEDIYLNADSSHMLEDLAFESLDKKVENWKADRVENMSDFFGDYNSANSNARTIDMLRRISKWDVSNVKNMSGLFRRFKIRNDYIQYVDNDLLASWNTRSLEDMSHMFEKSENMLTYVPGFASLDTSNVKDMSSIFSESWEPNYSALANWNTSNVENLYGAFSKTAMINLNAIGSWNVKKVKNMNSTFSCYGIYKDNNGNWNPCAAEYYANSARSLSALSGWETDSLETMSHIFDNAAIESLEPLSGWNVSKVKDMSYMLQGEKYLTSLNGLDSWTTSSLENLKGTFTGLQSVDISAIARWDVSKLKTMESTFELARVSHLDAISGWKTYNLENMISSFKNANLRDMDMFEDWEVGNVTNMWETFSDNQYLQSISGLHKWDTKNVETMWGLFEGSSWLQNITGLEGWDVKKVKQMDHLFNKSAVSSLEPLTGWETNSLQSISYLVGEHRNLQSLDGLEGWNTSNVESMQRAFMGNSSTKIGSGNVNWSSTCSNELADISAISGWNIDSLVDYWGLEATFACNPKLPSLEDLSSWNPKHITNFSQTFSGDKLVENLQGMEKWGKAEEKASDLSYPYLQVDGMFMNMTNLEDVSALSGWNMAISNAQNMFRNDYAVSDWSYLNGMTKISGANTTNAFEGTWSGATKPNWY